MDLRALFAEWSKVEPLPAGWDYHAYFVNTEPRAIACTQGHEIHFVVKPEYRGKLITRKRIAEFLGPLLEDKSFLTTRVERGTPNEHQDMSFVERIGFVHTGVSPQFQHFMLCQLAGA